MKKLRVLFSGLVKVISVLLYIAVIKNSVDTEIISSFTSFMLFTSLVCLIFGSSTHEAYFAASKTIPVDIFSLLKAIMFKPPWIIFFLVLCACIAVVPIFPSSHWFDYLYELPLIFLNWLLLALLALQFTIANHKSKSLPFLFSCLTPTSLFAGVQIFFVVMIYFNIKDIPSILACLAIVLCFGALKVNKYILAISTDKSICASNLLDLSHPNSKSYISTATQMNHSGFETTRINSFVFVTGLSFFNLMFVFVMSRFAEESLLASYYLLNQVVTIFCFFGISYFEQNKHMLIIGDRSRDAVQLFLKKNISYLLISSPVGFVMALVANFYSFPQLRLNETFWFFSIFIVLSPVINSLNGPNGKILSLNGDLPFLCKFTWISSVSGLLLFVFLVFLVKAFSFVSIFSILSIPILLSIVNLLFVATYNLTLNRRMNKIFGIKLYS